MRTAIKAKGGNFVNSHFFKRSSLSVLKYAAVILLFVWTVAPLLWMFISSASDTKYLIDVEGSFLPPEYTFSRYQKIFSNAPDSGIKSQAEVFKVAIGNSLIVSIATTVVCLFFGTLASYAFARLRFKFRDHLLLLCLFAQMLPAISLVVPLFFILKKLQMNDKLISLVLVYTSFILAYVVWILTGYFKTISKDLEAAARIDGCSRLGAFIRVVVPVSGPGFVAVGVLAFLMAWDEFLYSLILINSQSKKTIPVAISEFVGQFGLDYGMMMTGGCIATVIPLVLALIFQRWITMGMTAGAIKE
ncbi:carbohydrate ABC transporter permease [Clostridiales bacterium NSJ-40]|uniref:Carbohydrate ABC transporter permease n=1 Tax=Yeguia hominis TaxID=2763662 RepID=A0A926DBV9_9FIRM|nr:carbohydrate ABC transporter permease [Yeguia hominis]